MTNKRDKPAATQPPSGGGGKGASANVGGQGPLWLQATGVLLIPLAIAGAGWAIQSQIAESSLRKDYVAIAVGVLSSTDEKQDKALRQWAVEVLSKNSPVPFSPQVQDALEKGQTTLGFSQLPASSPVEWWVAPYRYSSPAPSAQSNPFAPQTDQNTDEQDDLEPKRPVGGTN